MSNTATLTTLPERLSAVEAARYLGVSRDNLARDRLAGHLGVPFTRVGRLAIYSREDLDSWIAGASRDTQPDDFPRHRLRKKLAGDYLGKQVARPKIGEQHG